MFLRRFCLSAYGRESWLSCNRAYLCSRGPWFETSPGHFIPKFLWFSYLGSSKETQKSLARPSDKVLAIAVTSSQLKFCVKIDHEHAYIQSKIYLYGINYKKTKNKTWRRYESFSIVSQVEGTEDMYLKSQYFIKNIRTIQTSPRYLYITARGLVHVCDTTHLNIIHTLLIEDNINISSHPT